MLRKILVCLGASFVLTVVAILYSAGIPSPRGDADDVFEGVAQELLEIERGSEVGQMNGRVIEGSAVVE